MKHCPHCKKLLQPEKFTCGRSIEELFEVACKYFKMTKEDVRKLCRKREMVNIRHQIAACLRTEFGYEMDTVAKVIHRSDHTNIINSVKRVKNYCETEDEFRETYESFCRYMAGMRRKFIRLDKAKQIAA